MRILNLRYRGIDRATDVLSFPQFSDEELRAKGAEVETAGLQCFRTSKPLLGDIVINLPKAKKQAREHGLTFSEELRRLTIHGLLHLAGYDHEKSRYQKSKMESKEKELLAALSNF